MQHLSGKNRGKSLKKDGTFGQKKESTEVKINCIVKVIMIKIYVKGLHLAVSLSSKSADPRTI
jgi:hypothetical protein